MLLVPSIPQISLYEWLVFIIKVVAFTAWHHGELDFFFETKILNMRLGYLKLRW